MKTAQKDDHNLFLQRLRYFRVQISPELLEGE